MVISNLKLVNYRNHEYSDINFGKKVNIIYGNNAQGKTNILESLYLFATGRSHRTNKSRELIRFGTDYANVKITFESKSGMNTGEMVILTDQKRRIKINEVPINRIGQLMGFFNVVMFSPEDLNLIKEGPSQRRRFLDIGISQIRPNYFYYLQQYVKVLEQRNKLLKEISVKSSLKETLSVWDEKLVEYGSKIIWYRELYIKKLSEFARQVHFNITLGCEKLDISYFPGIRSDQIESEKKIKELFQIQLLHNSKREIESGMTLVGPHRDEIEFVINNVTVKHFASQGQQRTVVLSLKLAEMEFIKEYTGEYPVLLLDDIMSELDKSRQNFLTNKIEDKQVIITCTDIDKFVNYDQASFFKVEKGMVREGVY